jgi:O-antigen/teichoic acid export membrane protein
VIKRVRSVVSRNVQALRQRGSFAQNFAVTFSGTAAVAAIGLLVTPVMSRVYPPASYGQFAVFNAMISNLNLLTTLGYPGAMLQPRLRERFLALVQLSLLLTVGSVLLLTAVLLLAADSVRALLHLEGVGGWLYLAPLLLLLFNLNAIMFTWCTREKAFTKRAGVDVATTLAGRGFTLGYGWLAGGNVGGLVLGDLFNRLTATVSLLWGGIGRQVGELFRNVSWARMRSVAHEYREFPLYYLPANYVQTLSVQLPIYALSSGFGATTVGLYSFSASLLEMPISLIGNAIAPVFLQKATETHATEPERLPGLTLDLYYRLLYIGLVPFGLVTVYGDWIFRWVFGAQWEMAGLFTACLGYYYIFKLTSQATAGIYTVLGRQRFLLTSNVLLLLVRAAGLGLGLWQHSLNRALLLFGVGSLTVTFLTDLHILHLLRLPVGRVAVRSVVLIGCTLGFFYGLRLLLGAWFGLH